MADQTNLSLQTVILANIGGVDTEVNIIAASAQELLDTVATLTGKAGQSVSPAPQAPAPEPQVTSANPTPAGPTAPTAGAPSVPQPQQAAQPGPSAPTAGAVQAAATPSAASTGAPASDVTLPDVLGPARQLLQSPGGEDTLKQILAQHGAASISTADPSTYGAIKAAVEQALAI